jgi:hypothetical protein
MELNTLIECLRGELDRKTVEADGQRRDIELLRAQVEVVRLDNNRLSTRNGKVESWNTENKKTASDLFRQVAERDATIADLRRQLAEREGDGAAGYDPAKHDGDWRGKWTLRGDFWRVSKGQIFYFHNGIREASNTSLVELVCDIDSGRRTRIATPAESATFSPGPYVCDDDNFSVRDAKGATVAQAIMDDPVRRLLAASWEMHRLLRRFADGQAIDRNIVSAMLTRIEGRPS